MPHLCRTHRPQDLSGWPSNVPEATRHCSAHRRLQHRLQQKLRNAHAPYPRCSAGCCHRNGRWHRPNDRPSTAACLGRIQYRECAVPSVRAQLADSPHSYSTKLSSACDINQSSRPVQKNSEWAYRPLANASHRPSWACQQPRGPPAINCPSHGWAFVYAP